MWKRNRIDKVRIEKENKQREDLKSILATARRIIKNTDKYEETHPIYLLIKHLVDQELYNNIYRSISTHNPNKVKFFALQDLLPCQNDGDKGVFFLKNNDNKYLYKDDFDNFISYEKFIDETKIVGKVATINLGFDPVLTRPWNEKRLVNAFSNIGRGKRGGEWKEDGNHKAQLWLPFGITFVSSGNHSITAGILNNEGQLKINSIYDMSKIFPHIYCDGVNYFRKRDDSLYAPVRNFSLAVVFEIGRLINEQRYSGNSIQFKKL